MDLCQ